MYLCICYASNVKRFISLILAQIFFLAIALICSALGMFAPIFYIDSYHPKTKLVVSAIAIPIFILGLIILSGINKKERNCKVCNGKKTLIRLDTPKAIEIIKENNLFPPEEPVEPPKPKLPWQMD